MAEMESHSFAESRAPTPLSGGRNRSIR